MLAASYSPEDGHATPEAVVQGYAFAARALGAHLQTSCEVDRDRASRRPDRARSAPATAASRTDTVICAAGAWSRRCGELAGVDLPVSPAAAPGALHRADGRPARQAIPMTIDFSTTFYFHGEGPGLLMGMSDPTETPGFNIETTDEWIPALLEIAQRRAPRVAEAGIQGRLGGPLRHEPGPQRDHRRGRRTCRASSTPPGSPATASCRARRPARSCATSCLRRGPVRRHRAAERRPLRRRATCAPSTTSSDARAARSSARPDPSNVDVAADALRDAIVRRPLQARRAASRRSRWPSSSAISRGPIRDALRLLERDGPGRGDPQPRRGRPRGPRRSTCSRSTRCGPRSARSRCTS